MKKSIYTPSLFLASFLITGFILVNAFELAFARDLFFSSSLKRVDITLPEALGNESHWFDRSSQGIYGKPTQLKITTTDSRIQLVPALLDGNNWLSRANGAHYIFVGESENGSISDLLIYVRQSWRTANSVRDISEGDNIFIDTDSDWRHMYRVKEVYYKPKGEPYVLNESRVRQLAIEIVQNDHNENLIVRAEYVTLQNIQR